MTISLHSYGRDPRRIWLARSLRVQASLDAEIAAALATAVEDAARAIRESAGKPGIGATARKAQLIGSQGALTIVLHDYFRKLYAIIHDRQITAAREAAKAGFAWEKDILQLIEPDASKRRHLEVALVQSAGRGVSVMITRILHSQMKLSKQVYRTEALARNQVYRAVNSSIALGDSAADLAKKVLPLISPDTPGGVKHASRRLGRTEVNNAFHAQAIKDAQEKPWILGMQWHLSRQHQLFTGEKCEVYAAQNAFPTHSVPRKPHPQCMCFVVPETMPLDMVLEKVTTGEISDWISKKALPAA